ncbi:MAG: hypothetical protein JNN27_03390 [Planctomycetes bacterium]|nr:hypothetical protein [Planctomycetota bacterium]
MRGRVNIGAALGLALCIALAAGVCGCVARGERPGLREQLLELRDRDQAAREAVMASLREGRAPDAAELAAVRQADEESLRFLEQLLAAPGWPTAESVGAEAAHAAWLLAQHADARPDLQREVLARMEPLARSGRADPSDFAYLTDRVLVAERRPQRFGTQFSTDAAGVQRPFPLEAPAELERRRAEFGLPPMANYVRMLSEALGASASAEPMTEFPAPAIATPAR